LKADEALLTLENLLGWFDEDTGAASSASSAKADESYHGLAEENLVMLMEMNKTAAQCAGIDGNEEPMCRSGCEAMILIITTG
jgi:hypothetical protein